MKLYMFRTMPLSIIWSSFTLHSAMVYVIHGVLSWSCSKDVYKPLWHTPSLSVQWMNSWWWTEELSETCRVSCQNKYVKLVHLVGFVIKNIQNYLVHMQRTPKYNQHDIITQYNSDIAW